MSFIFNRIVLLCVAFLPFFTEAQNDSLPHAAFADTLLEKAMEQLGVPYKYATSAPGVSFDCSGFTAYVYGSMGIPASRGARDYMSLGTQVSLEECRKGDCMVFSGPEAGSTLPGHVGIVVSNENGQIRFIHSSSSKKHYGVVITDYYDSNYPKRFLSVRRMF
jgi:cell wall-associated NlpC family hydrolase